MNRLYRFSPIQNKEQVEQVYEYLVVELDKLARAVLGVFLPITTLKIFPHYFEEYEYLHSLVAAMGEPADFNSKTSFYTKSEKKINDSNIKFLGVRIVDPYRLHVGCGDYEVENFEEFKKKYVDTSPFIRSFRDDMLEIWHPDFDVLGYAVGKE